MLCQPSVKVALPVSDNLGRQLQVWEAAGAPPEAQQAGGDAAEVSPGLAIVEDFGCDGSLNCLSSDMCLGHAPTMAHVPSTVFPNKHFLFCLLVPRGGGGLGGFHAVREID
jgi:hypothetical protein